MLISNQSALVLLSHSCSGGRDAAGAGRGALGLAAKLLAAEVLTLYELCNLF